MTRVLGEPPFLVLILPFSLQDWGLHLRSCAFASCEFIRRNIQLQGVVTQGPCPLLLTILTRSGSRRLIVFVQMNWNLRNSTLTLSPSVTSCADFINWINNIWAFAPLNHSFAAVFLLLKLFTFWTIDLCSPQQLFSVMWKTDAKSP